MKRIFSFLIILAMGLSMVSCVNNTESDSVKAIREAKAAQLLALAELHNAQAQAETLLAAAQAALLEAEARYQNALAEGKEMQNQLAKETLELEIQMIKAELESELYRLLEDLAQYKDDLNTELYSQLEYWFTELKNEQGELVTLKASLVTLRGSAATAQAALVEKIRSLKLDIILNDTFIAEAQKYVDGLGVNLDTLEKAVAQYEVELEMLSKEMDVLSVEIDDFDFSDIEDAVDEINKMFTDPTSGIWKKLNYSSTYNGDVLYLFSAPSLIGGMGDVVLDAEVYVAEESKAHLEYVKDVLLSDLKESYSAPLGTEGDKYDSKKTYTNNTLYAHKDYWTERLATYSKDFRDQVLAAQKAVKDAADVFNKAYAMPASTLEETTARNAAMEAANPALVAALDALDKYTKPTDGLFYKYLEQTYNPSTLDYSNLGALTLFSPLGTNSANFILDGGVVKTRTYYKYQESMLENLEHLFSLKAISVVSDVIKSVHSYIDMLSLQSDQLATTVAELPQIMADMLNSQIDTYAEMSNKYYDLSTTYTKKMAELRAAMLALLNGSDMSDVMYAVELREAIEEAKAENELIKEELALLEANADTPETVLYDITIREIKYKEAKIELINKIIDQLEAQLSSLVNSNQGSNQ